MWRKNLRWTILDQMNQVLLDGIKAASAYIKDVYFFFLLHIHVVVYIIKTLEKIYLRSFIIEEKKILNGNFEFYEFTGCTKKIIAATDYFSVAATVYFSIAATD